MKKNSKPEVIFPLAAFLEMAEEFFFNYLFFFQPKQMWPEAKHLTCSVSAQMVKAWRSHMQEKTGPVIKLPGVLQMKILLAAQLLSCRGTY